MKTVISLGQYLLCWTSLVVQMVKNLPAMQETRVESLGREDPLEKGMATHSSILPGKSQGRRSLTGCSGLFKPDA